MKYTLLELTQNILSSIDGDEINSISDTVESQQVVQIIKTCYNDIISRGNISLHKGLFTLDSSLDVAKPVLMTKPTNVTSIEWLKYNRADIDDVDPLWREVDYKTPEDFIQTSQNLNPSEDNIAVMVLTVGGFTFSIHYKTDESPLFYTSFDDNTIVFDGFDSGVDSTLQTSKTLGFGIKNLVFTEIDSFVPELQSDQFSLLLNEAKSLAWAEMKQMPHQKAELTARRNWTHLARTRQHIPDNVRNLGRNYGRK